MKTLFTILLVMLGVAAQAQVIFLCQPRNFVTPQEPDGYNVEGISAQALNPSLGDTSALYCYFQFYKKSGSGYISVGGDNASIPLKVTIGPTTYFLHKMLFSGNKNDVYTAGTIFATAKGYTLLPLNQQTYINSRYP